MNKATLIQSILDQLKEKVAQHLGAARAAHAEATDEESKAEDKYDTRGLEASYLAAGQARQLEEAAAALQQFASMVVPRFGAGDAIDIGALVEVKTKEGESLFFIGPCAGGTEVVLGQKTVLVITPQSPLGQQFVGRRAGDRLKVRIAGRLNEYHIAAVT
jgi:transcription elongation GreA/GreB family factor